MNDLLPGTTTNFWANKNQTLRDYYVNDWGRPKHQDQEVFELLVLEIFSSGLNWMMMLNKRANFKRAFLDYDIERVAAMDDDDVATLMADTSIVRNRQKITAAIANAQAILRLRHEFPSFAAYLWSFTDGEQIVHAPASQEDTPNQDDLSKRVAKDMKKRGFHFIGPVIAYSYLQAIGVIDDHLVIPDTH